MKVTVVLSALELGLFEVVGPTDWTTTEAIAEALEIKPSRLFPLLEALGVLGYLVRDERGRFKAPAEVCSFLSSSSPEFRGPELRRLLRTIKGWSWLSDVIRRDQPKFVGDLDDNGSCAPPTHTCLAVRGHRSGQELVNLVDLGHPGTILDLGGGAGGYAMAFCDAFRDAEVTLLDLPDVIPLSRRHLSERGYARRIDLVAGDFMKPGAIPRGPFDLVLIANVLHIYAPEQAADLVRRAARAVAPAGFLVIRDGMVDPGRSGPSAALLFGIHVCVFSTNGRIYATDEIESMIVDAGMELVDTIRPDADSEGVIILGRAPERR